MDQWLELLRASPSFATRLQPPVATSRVVEGGGDDLAEFLAALASSDRALMVDGLDLVTGAYAAFLERRLPGLIGSLRSLRADELAEVGPAMAGQPVWGRTVLGWTSGALAADRMISRVTTRRLDLPENQTLKLLLRHLAMLSGGIVAKLADRAHPRLRQIAALSAAALREPAIRAIGNPGGPSERLLSSAEGASDPAYREVGQLLRRRLALSVVDDLGRWRRSAYAATLSTSTLAPIDAEDVFELLALARVFDALEDDLALGPPRSFWMRIRTGARGGPVAEFGDGQGGSVEIYFNRTPSFLLDTPTRYAEVFQRHKGLGLGSDRRPDIVVVRYARGGKRSIFFLEAKLPGPSSSGGYVRDSIYKAFGYLYDFAGLWDETQSLKIGLYVSTDVGPTAEAAATPKDIVLLSPNRPKDLAKALAQALDLEGPA